MQKSWRKAWRPLPWPLAAAAAAGGASPAARGAADCRACTATGQKKAGALLLSHAATGALAGRRHTRRQTGGGSGSGSGGEERALAWRRCRAGRRHGTASRGARLLRAGRGAPARGVARRAAAQAGAAQIDVMTTSVSGFSLGPLL